MDDIQNSFSRLKDLKHRVGGEKHKPDRRGTNAAEERIDPSGSLPRPGPRVAASVHRSRRRREWSQHRRTASPFKGLTPLRNPYRLMEATTVEEERCTSTCRPYALSRLARPQRYSIKLSTGWNFWRNDTSKPRFLVFLEGEKSQLGSRAVSKAFGRATNFGTLGSGRQTWDPRSSRIWTFIPRSILGFEAVARRGTCQTDGGSEGFCRVWYPVAVGK